MRRLSAARGLAGVAAGVVVLVGVAAGALSTLVADYPTFRNYVILALSPFVCMALIQGAEAQMLLAVTGIGLIVFLLNSSRQNFRSIEENLRLSRENIALITDLRRRGLLDDTVVMITSEILPLEWMRRSAVWWPNEPASNRSAP